jgi:protein-tyrosine-phosphatase
MIKDILCVCKGNRDLSPMSAGLLIKALKSAAVLRNEMRMTAQANNLSKIRVESASVYTGEDDAQGNPVSGNAFQCMYEMGINLKSHKSRPISAINIHSFDLIICMSVEQMCAVARLRPRGMILLANAVNGGVPDPFGKEIDGYRECRAMLARVANEVVQTYVLGATWTNPLQTQAKA